VLHWRPELFEIAGGIEVLGRKRQDSPEMGLLVLGLTIRHVKSLDCYRTIWLRVDPERSDRWVEDG
jgi:hypothetical protein